MQVSDADIQSAMRSFFRGIKTQRTRALYERNFNYFLKYVGKDADAFVKLDSKTQTALIDKYMCSMEGSLSSNTIRSRFAPIKLFCIMNDVSLNFEKLQKGLPSVETHQERLPSKEEIKALYDNCRIQGRVLLKLLLESGMRIEGLSELKRDNFEPIDKEICKVTVYADSKKDAYVTFCSIETYDQVMKLPKSKVSANSKVKRVGDIFPHTHGCRSILYRGWKRAGIKIEFPSNHFARKYFKTNAERSGAKEVWIECLLGHSTGLNRNYLREDFGDLVDAYRKILPYLSLSGNGNGNGETRENVKSLQDENATLRADLNHLAEAVLKLQGIKAPKGFTFEMNRYKINDEQSDDKQVTDKKVADKKVFFKKV